MSLIDALADAKTEVINGADASCFAEIASFYEINPALLTRKFNESYGSIEGCRAMATAMANPARCQSTHARAEQVAADWAARYNGRSSHYGKRFTYKGERYIFVVRDGGCRKWGLKAVRCSDAAQIRMTLACWDLFNWA